MLFDEFRSLVVAQLLTQLPDKAVAIEALTEDDDLLGSGLVDSYALIELCLALEACTGVAIDIGVLEPEQFGSIGALFEVVSAANQNINGEAGATEQRLAS